MLVAIVAVVLGLPLAAALAAPACRAPAANARIKVNLTPDTEVTDLIPWSRSYRP
jgi:hypothetical protein